MARNEKTNNKYPLINEYGKLPPQDIVFEEEVLGSLMTYPKDINIVIKYLKPESFYKIANGIIYKHIIKLNKENKPFNPSSVVHSLKLSNELEEVGGPYYITLLSMNSIVFDMVFHCQVLFELHIRRVLIKLFTESTDKLYDISNSLDDIYDNVINVLENIYGDLGDEIVNHINKSIDEAIKEMTDINSGKVVSYLITKDRLLDELVYLSSGNIIGIFSPRGAGKTRQLIYYINQIFSNNKNVSALWYSLEDSDKKIVRSFASMRTGLNEQQMLSKGYKLSDIELNNISNAMRTFSSWDIDIINKATTISNISHQFTRFRKKRKNNYNILIIDNIMLLEDISKSLSNNQTAVEDNVAASIRSIMTNSLLDDQKCIIIFLHHMTKELENKSNLSEAYRPRLANIKGSTRFADVCTTAILMSKPGMYKDLIKIESKLPDIKLYNKDGKIGIYQRKKILEKLVIVEVAKNRDGDIVDDEKAIARYFVDLGKMNYHELKSVK